MKSSFMRVFVPVLGATAVLAGAAWVIFAVPPVSEQLPLETPNTVIFFVTPVDGSILPVNEQTIIKVGLLGNVMEMLEAEFWVDGALHGTQILSPLQDLDSAAIDWTPETGGVHVLQARLNWTNGHVSDSDPVRVLILPGITLPDVINTQLGEDLLRINYFYYENSLSPYYFTSKDTGGEAVSENQLPTGNRYRQKMTFWLRRLLDADKIPPNAPILAVEKSYCDVKLSLLDNSSDEFGFFLYRGAAGESSLARIASLAANHQDVILEYIDLDQSGLLTYVVSAYNSAGESPSNPVNVEVFDPACSGLDPLGWLVETFNIEIMQTEPSPTPEMTPLTREIAPLTFIPEQNANCRSGPAVEFPVMSYLPVNISVPVEGRNSDGSWLLLQPLDGLLCWVWAELGSLTGGIEDLAVESGPPLPVSTMPVVSDPTRTPCPPSHFCP